VFRYPDPGGNLGRDKESEARVLTCATA